jgi:hypothetical protein
MLSASRRFRPALPGGGWCGAPGWVVSSREMKFLIGFLLLGGGIITLVRREQAAASGARFNQRMAKVFPPWGWGNPNVSEDAWRYMAPAIAIFMIAGGVLILIFVPS